MSMLDDTIVGKNLDTDASGITLPSEEGSFEDHRVAPGNTRENLGSEKQQAKTPDTGIQERNAEVEKEVEKKPQSMFNRVLSKISAISSILGGLGGVAGSIISICVLAGVAVCPPLAALAAIAAGVAFLGIICDVVNKATDTINYDTERNKALGVQAGGYALKIAGDVAGVLCANIPIVGTIATVAGVIGSLTSLKGFLLEILSDYKKNRLREEYGSEFIANILGWIARNFL
ncbi:MAG: hypothetical protein LBQ23_00210 [Puniceicoccales bacterium]|jgi:hypothetical protein|nr:hypothetical protein [Puniceicoccales bacterium]